MASPRSHQALHLDVFFPTERWWDESLSATLGSPSFDLPGLRSDMDKHDLENFLWDGPDSVWDFGAFSTVAPKTPRPESVSNFHHSSLESFFRQFDTDIAHKSGEQQSVPPDHGGIDGSRRASSKNVVEAMRSTSTPNISCSQMREASTPRTAKQVLRRQNRSCDQCRSAKRACDLPNDGSIQLQRPSKACSLCAIRGMECTTTWLAKKQSALRSKKRPGVTTTSVTGDSADLAFNAAGEGSVDMVVSPAISDADLGRSTIAQATCSQHFNLYVDVFDIPISHCLFLDSMPPGYSMGLAALYSMKDSSSLARCMSKANDWIKSCWDLSYMAGGSANPAPHIFCAASVLDAVFQRTGAQPYRSSMTSRDAAITESYKWAAVALAAQFAPSHGGEKGYLDSQPNKYFAYRHDVALGAWEKAKQKVFGNISATTSFRAALSLLLFGLVPPPGSMDNSHELDEDADYALCEGIRRLHTLCSKARARISEHNELSGSNSVTVRRGAANGPQDLPHLSPEDSKYILELIGAVEWLVNLFNAVAIGTTRGKTQAFPSHTSETSTVHRPHDTSMSKTSLMPGEDTLWIFRRHGHGRTNSALMQTEVPDVSFTTLWSRGANEDLLLQSLRRLAYLAVVIWKSVADLTMAIETTPWNKSKSETIFGHFKTTLSLVQKWRTKFGILDTTMRECFDKATCEIWRTVAFTSNDCDLAILLFCDLIQRFEIELAQQQFTPETERLRSALRSTSGFRKMQRLISAEQVSLIASTCQQASRPGFEGKGGLKSRIQDIAAHPVSRMQDKHGVKLTDLTDPHRIPL
jgi:hypothetical protein